MATCEKHQIDKGQLSRFRKFVREEHARKLGEAEGELYFWQEATRLLDSTRNSNYNTP